MTGMKRGLDYVRLADGYMHCVGGSVQSLGVFYTGLLGVYLDSAQGLPFMRGVADATGYV
jgi:hypothetical protein